MTRGRPREFDRSKALRAAMLVFWRKGFVATSMTDLCKAMDIGSPSLYAAFGSKERLYAEAVTLYVHTVRPLLWRHFKESIPARACIENFLLEAARLLRKSGKAPGGCMITLAILDEDLPEPLPDLLRDARREGLELMRVRMATALGRGELPAGTDVTSLSRLYLGVFQGMVAQAHDGATRSELEGVARAAMTAWPA
ncbi:MAG: TetR/AcrR family transcriptional regulator [Proteobacteria bacterium]|nr:TetR/AcrR family transcriptional regulator [Pseudomonadota bacterium]